MKKSIIYVIILLIAVTFIAAIPTQGEEQIYNDVIRLHILANSDSNEDQELKIDVRNKILEVYGENLSSYQSIETAAEEIPALMNDISFIALSAIRDAGYDYGVTVSFTEEEYPTRTYENFAMPAGKYLSLRVVIGEGRGQNWWCVLFPPLCTSAACNYSESGYDSLPAGLTEDEYCLITSDEKKYQIKFKTLELLSELIGK